VAKRKFVSEDFQVPESLVTNRMKLRMLSVSDVVKDYDAVMSSCDHLMKTIPFGPDHKWPIGLSLEQNLIDLGWHQKEFQRRSSFAYTVLTLDENQCLGCVYIDPSNKKDFDAEICLWVRQSELETGLDGHLFSTVKDWISKDWPFKNVAYPGREIDWDVWASLNIRDAE